MSIFKKTILSILIFAFAQSYSNAQTLATPDVADFNLEMSKSIEAEAKSDPSLKPLYVEGQIYIKFTSDAGKLISEGNLAEGTLMSEGMPDTLKMLHRRFGATRISSIAPRQMLDAEKLQKLVDSSKRATGRVDSLPRVDLIYRLELTGDISSALVAYGSDKNVEYVERILRPSLQTNDAFYNPTDMWGAHQINANSAWGTSTGSGIVVAVIDSGVDTNHPDLANSIFTNPNDIWGNGIDDDNNGFVDDTFGWDFVDNDNQTDDPNGHGTHVAGIIAAEGDNLLGVVGVAYDAKIMPIRTFDSQGQGAADMGAAMMYAVLNGADVINNSWGAFGYSQVYADIIDFAHGMGIATVSSAGNRTKDACRFTPASVENAITVGATDVGMALTSYSNFGVKIDVVAPGGSVTGQGGSATRILSTIPSNSVLGTSQSQYISTGIGGEKYLSTSGTSMSAPFVSGAIALLMQHKPTWQIDEIIQTLRQSSVDLGTAGIDHQYGHGIIDLNAILAASSPPPVASLRVPQNCKDVPTTFSVVGSANSPSFQNYQIAIGAGQSPSSFTVVQSSTTPVTNGVLGNVDMSSYGTGDYVVQLTTTDINGNKSEDRNIVRYDSRLQTGVPIVTDAQSQITSSPKLVDLDNDGAIEIVLGTAVFLHDGSVRAGWDGDPGFSRSNPAILDIDSDGKKEVIGIEYLCHRYSSMGCGVSLANNGAPIVHAWRHDRDNSPSGPSVWSYNIEHWDPTAPFSVGAPSSVSVGNVDGDVAAEVVFTVVFDYANPDLETTLFVLDAATGTEKLRMNVGGVGSGSVALADMNRDGRQEIIFSTNPDQGDGKIYVLKGDGTPLDGWPIANIYGRGWADPVIADVDNDFELEILIGYNLFEADGTVKPAWNQTGVVGWAHTGLIAPLDPNDLEMEVVLSNMTNLTLNRIYNHDRTFRTLTSADENVLPIGFFTEPPHPGNPIVGDLDGDGILEVIQSSHRGNTFLLPSFYVKRADSISFASDDRFRVFEPGWVLRSTPAIGDLDGDGDVELVATAGQRLFIWDMAGSIGASQNIWPMFQHNLLNTGTIPITTNRGLTWMNMNTSPTAATVTVGCGSDDLKCNPISGDMQCSALKPVLCINKSSDLPRPLSVVVPNNYFAWAGGVVATTPPVSPLQEGFQNISDVNAFCQTQFGANWRTASHHDGWGWNFQAYGNTSALTDRFWVNIRDQTGGNCWSNSLSNLQDLPTE